MNKNEDKRSLNDDEIEKISGGRITEKVPKINMVAYGGPCITSPDLDIKPIMKKYGGPGMFYPKDKTKETENKPKI